MSSTAVAASLTGFSVRLIVNPLDVIKVRWQLQVEAISRDESAQRKLNKGFQSKYQSWGQTLSCLLKEEGLKAFWKGHLSGQMLTITFNAIQFSAYKHLTSLADNGDFVSKTLANQFVVGGISGSLATIGAMPLDVLRTRLVSQGIKKVYSSIPNAVNQIGKTEGLLGFYRGLYPALLQTFPAGGMTFGFYHVFNKSIKSTANIDDNTANMTAGFLSGLLVKCIVHPLDVLKKRLMIQGFGEARKDFGRFVEYRGVTDCAWKMLREEGLNSFFKGISPNLVKGGVSTALTFGFFELYCKYLKNETDLK